MTRKDPTPVVTEDDRQAYLRRVGRGQKSRPVLTDPDDQLEEPDQPTGLAVASALLLVAMLAVPALALAALMSRRHEPVDPTALFLFLLWVPTSFVAWVAVTVRALHKLEIKFWEMRSTWVAAGCCFAIVFVGVMWTIFAAMAEGRGGLAPSVHVVAAALIVALVGWVFVLDYRATRSVPLAMSVAALHVVAGFGVIFAIHRLLEIFERDDRA